jgi:putative membrane protein
LFGRRWRRAAENSYGPRARTNPARQAEATLARRFAQGAIDETEYRARLEVLRANAG